MAVRKSTVWTRLMLSGSIDEFCRSGKCPNGGCLEKVAISKLNCPVKVFVESL